MEIKNAKYVKDLIDENILYVNITVGDLLMTVPLETANRHYVEIMRQVAAGELTIEDAD
tara:strand:- start:23582 stop:23758 length:177 start_codon:yes stop_codon:yes gene_type:complete